MGGFSLSILRFSLALEEGVYGASWRIQPGPITTQPLKMNTTFAVICHGIAEKIVSTSWFNITVPIFLEVVTSGLDCYSSHAVSATLPGT